MFEIYRIQELGIIVIDKLRYCNSRSNKNDDNNII